MVRFFPSLKHGWGFTAPQNKRKMENQEEKQLNNTYPKVVDVYIKMDNGYESRVFKKADDEEMENQEEKETSIEYFYDKVLDASEFYESEYQAIVDALNEAKKMYDEEIENAYKKGYIQGAKEWLEPFKKQIWEGAKNRYLKEQKEQYDYETKLRLNINK